MPGVLVLEQRQPAAYQMGSAGAGEEGHDSDETRRRVTIREPFAVGVREVTFAEWDAYVSASGCAHHHPVPHRRAHQANYDGLAAPYGGRRAGAVSRPPDSPPARWRATRSGCTTCTATWPRWWRTATTAAGAEAAVPGAWCAAAPGLGAPVGALRLPKLVRSRERRTARLSVRLPAGSAPLGAGIRRVRADQPSASGHGSGALTSARGADSAPNSSSCWSFTSPPAFSRATIIDGINAILGRAD